MSQDQTPNSNQIQKILPELNRLHEESLSLLLATLSVEGLPRMSYSPFVYLNNAYYIYISKLAQHTQDIEANPRFSMMMIDDESKTRNIYARARLSFDVDANLVERESEEYKTALDGLKNRAGGTVDLLSSLSDFLLFKLVPVQGRLVVGFGQAYEIQPNDLSEVWQVTDKEKILIKLD